MEDKIELQIRNISNNRCDICHKQNADIYILDNSKKQDLDNLILLCDNCATTYIGNPDLIKQLKEIRNNWHKTVQNVKEQNKEITDFVDKDEGKNKKRVAIYHVVYEYENFEQAAQDIFRLLKESKKQANGREILLYLDIDGHLDEYGNFDDEMKLLQEDFILKTIFPFFSEICIPILDVKNRNKPREDIPDKLEIVTKSKYNIPKTIITKGGYLVEKLGQYYSETEKTLIFVKD